MKYGVPAITVAGKGIIGYQARKDGCSLFPMSGSVLSQVSSLPPGTTAHQGTLHFGADQRLPLRFLKEVVRLRLAELGSVSGGTRIEVFSDGGVKAIGQMKEGALHGRWEWFRQDGSVLRKGTFCKGEPVGWWETWDADGALVSKKRRSGETARPQRLA